MDTQVLEVLQLFGFVCVQELVEETSVHFGYISISHQRETPINSHSNGGDFRFARGI